MISSVIVECVFMSYWEVELLLGVDYFSFGIDMKDVKGFVV